MSTHRFVQRRGVILLLLLILNVLIADHPSTIIYAQDPTERRLEAEAAEVIQTGAWTKESATQASGGSYLYSSGAEANALTLEFTGTAIEVIYVAGPQLGTLAIEVDGTVLRTVITTSEQTAYQQSTRINYLTDEPHTLNVYAQEGGVIAIDAFVLSRLATPTPTPLPTEEAVLAAGEQEEGGIQSSTCSPVSHIHLVSKSTGGQLGNTDSHTPRLSADGRFVVFLSSASNLIPGDSNGATDVFVYDRQTCIIRIVSVSSQGNIAMGGASDYPDISADGHYIAFRSTATNLIPNDTNGRDDIFVHDRPTGITTRVSVGAGGIEGNERSFAMRISGDGRYVAFHSRATNLIPNDTNGRDDIFVHDRPTGITTRVSVGVGGAEANQSSFSPVLSSDGRFITFISGASNLVPNDTNGISDVFVYDRQTNTTTRVSVASGGTQITSGQVSQLDISGDGRYVTFTSSASALVPNDTNGRDDIFVHDRQANTTTRVSVGTGGIQADSSADFHTISGDGRYVVFESGASNLVAGDTNATDDSFVHDRTTGTTTRISVSVEGVQGNSFSLLPVISTDGHYIAFLSNATNLISGDNNNVSDVFVAPLSRPAPDALALFSPTFKSVGVFDTLADNPAAERFTAFSAYAPVARGQWVMGDWNEDGLKTPGVYVDGAFFYTNKSGESAPSDWSGLWIGINGPAVAGRFSGIYANECIGAVEATLVGGQLAFVLYFTCDLTGNPVPVILSQWLSVVLPDSGGFTGAHQFGAGDFDGDGVDSIAVRRGPYIAFGNVEPGIGPATFNFAQYIGVPAVTDYGIFVVGSWDNDVYDSFGLFYQSGEFFYRNDLLFNSGAYGNQSVGMPFTGPIQATAWH